MDLETVRTKVDAHLYPTLGTFLRDLETIKHNAEEFNPRSLRSGHGRGGGASRNGGDLSHSAHSMLDTAHSMVYRLRVNGMVL
jgi:hypothetical protein